MIGQRHDVSPLQKQCLFSSLSFLSKPCDFWPTDDQSVITQCFLGTFAALADVVESVGQFTGGLCLPAQSGHQCRCSGFALTQGTDEVVYALPDSQALVRQRIPIRWQLVYPQQAHFASPGYGDARRLQAAYGGVFCFSQGFGITPRAVVVNGLGGPRYRPNR